MKKNFARAAVATGAAVGMLVTSMPAFAAGFDATSDSAQLPASDKVRIWGPSRGETAVQAVTRLEEANAVDNEDQEIFLVGGKAFADPLALTALADCTNSPVLMTQDANHISKSTLDKIKRIDSYRVTIVGGPLSVSDSVVNAVKGVVDRASTTVSRIAGPTRADTAADLAAYTVACYKGRYEDLRAARDEAARAIRSEEDYQLALRMIEEARKAYTVESNKLNALSDKLGMLTERLDSLTAKLKLSGDTAALKAAVAEAKGELDAAHVEAAKYDAANKFLSEMLSNKGIDQTTLNIKSTLWDYARYFYNSNRSELTTALQLHTRALGINLQDDHTTTVEMALDLSNGKVDAANQMVTDKSDAYGQAVAALADAVAADSANAQVNKQIAPLAEQIAMVKAEILKQVVKVDAANAALSRLGGNLAGQALHRPKPTAVADATRQLRAGLDDAMRSGGASTVFLADGNKFPDALVGGPAAAFTGGVVLLTQGASLPAATDKYLKAAKAQVVTVGVPAAQAVKGDRAITLKQEFSGNTRYDTAAAVTKYYFGLDTDANHQAPYNAHPVAVASGEQFADAVLASNFIAQFDGGVLLTKKNEVPVPTLNYLNNFSKTGGVALRVFGGNIWVSDGVVNTLAQYNGR